MTRNADRCDRDQYDPPIDRKETILNSTFEKAMNYATLLGIRFEYALDELVEIGIKKLRDDRKK